MRQNYVRGEKLEMGFSRVPSILVKHLKQGDTIIALFKGTYTYTKPAKNGDPAKDIHNLQWELREPFEGKEGFYVDAGAEVFINGAVLNNAHKQGMLREGKFYELVCTGFAKGKMPSLYATWDIFSIQWNGEEDTHEEDTHEEDEDVNDVPFDEGESKFKTHDDEEEVVLV